MCCHRLSRRGESVAGRCSRLAIQTTVIGECTNVLTDASPIVARVVRLHPLGEACISNDCVTFTPTACQGGKCICPPGSYDCRNGCHSVTHPVCCPTQSTPAGPGLVRPTPSAARQAVGSRTGVASSIKRRQRSAAVPRARLLLRSAMDGAALFRPDSALGHLPPTAWGLDPARRQHQSGARRWRLPPAGPPRGSRRTRRSPSRPVLGRPRCNVGRCSASVPTS